MKNSILTFALALAAIPMVGTAWADDEVVVVKGQVSDYYIPVSHKRTIKGQVLDQAGRPLEGATVMWFASPIHVQTDADGHFTLDGEPHETRLYIWYPGMEFTDSVITLDQLDLRITMTPDRGRKVQRRLKAQATEWYDADHYHPTTYCNPMNISYNFEPYNNNTQRGGSFRSSADPMALSYGDEVFLFSTNQNGFHYSKDLSTWEFAPASFKRRPADDDQCAPAAYVVGDTLFYTGSTYEGLPVWWSTSPKSGKWRRAIERNTLPSWDPWLFLDDDGKLYLYYGSSNEYPLKGVQVSRDDFHPVSKICDVLMLQPEKHGWERFGMNNDDSTTLRPFTEGAEMIKHDGQYYLLYGAPGTEFKTYADGVYVADSPLGPFTYQPHNPMSYKPGGFVRGSGHGGTFRDPKGNLWHVSTCMLSNKYKFERRIALYPAGFDADGVLYSSAAYGDYPTLNGLNDIADPARRCKGWMLLSLNRPAQASSVDSVFVAANASDENMRTYWSAASAEPGEWYMIDLEAPKDIRAVQVNYYENRATQHDRANDIYHQYRLWSSLDGNSWTLVADKSDADTDTPHDYIELAKPLNARYLKVENVHTPSGYFCLSDLRVFGLDPAQPLPIAPKGLKVNRSKIDPRNALITWKPSEGAYGYNLYYGIAPDKMYNAITVLGDTSYDMRGLDMGTTYYFSIEALGEAGPSPRTKPHTVR